MKDERDKAAMRQLWLCSAHNLDETLELLSTYVMTYPAFRNKPVGAPGSEARRKQDFEIALEDRAIALVAKLREE